MAFAASERDGGAGRLGRGRGGRGRGGRGRGGRGRGGRGRGREGTGIAEEPGTRRSIGFDGKPELYGPA